MKIAQIVGRSEGSGVTRYIIELNKSFIKAGHDATVYIMPSDFRNNKNNMQVIENFENGDYTQDFYDKVNSADLVVINALIDKKANDELRDKFYDFVINKIKVRKIYICNEHKLMGISTYYGKWHENKEFIDSIDKICTFSADSVISNKLKEMYGNDRINNMFMQLSLPYEFDESRKLWVDAKDKLKRLTYLGRFATFKDPHRILPVRQKLFDAGFEYEMRGIGRTIAVAFIPDLFYEIKDGQKVGDSKVTIPVTKKWYLENNITLGDPLIDWDGRIKDKIYIFDQYKREDGMAALAKSAFGVDFYHLKTAPAYGDTLEYCLYEIMDTGTIPVMDSFTGNSCHILDNGYASDKTFIDMNAGVFLDKDCANIDEFVANITELYNDPDKYNDMRERTFEIFKEHGNQVAIANRFIEDAFK